ncbi:MAG TPA: isoprenyl transferase [Alphaproteobacteria bacterium]|jgi:undecaprenyl diphosphate synthase|nr:isoprenyl transferase [Alphaproteobacteria bacterium]
MSASADFATDLGPQHVAVIMDGNGRWAQAKGMFRTAGHRSGMEAVRRIVEAAREIGLPYLTIFGFSAENWGRPVEEVEELMLLLRLYLRSEIADLHKNGVRLRVIGERSRLAPDIVNLIEHGESLTKNNAALNFTVALSYGGRQDMVQAAQRLAAAAVKGEIAPGAIDQEAISARLWTCELPDPDLVIRTSGEQRISNFFLWQAAYAELVFLDTLWPDFSKADLEQAIREFRRRERRYGAVVSGR